VSLAHRGVLFLDETPEFSRRSLEALRAPLEDRVVAIARAARRVIYPASFSLVCAMNPCPCGHLGDDSRACRCSARQVEAYRARLSGPLLDRIDLHVELGRVPEEALASARPAEPSAEVRARVVAARWRQSQRNLWRGAALSNAELAPQHLEQWAVLGTGERQTLIRAARRLGLTARSWHRVVKVARTLADLGGEAEIGERHLLEALTYRLLDRDRRPLLRIA
jgi:magnesium chelatase family protein